MDKMKQFVVMTVVASVAILALGYNFLVAPKKATANDLRAQTDAQVSANAQLRTELTVLKGQAKLFGGRHRNADGSLHADAKKK